MTQKCNLILDSCCDLPLDVVDQEGIELINFRYILDETEHLDDLYQLISCSDFFDGMRKGKEPTTSQVPASTYEEVFRNAIKSGVPTVYLSFSSQLSGSYDTAEVVASRLKQENPGAELFLVDTKLGSVAEGFLVYEAIRQRERGMTAQELVTWAEEARYYVDAEFMVDDLEALRRGGRIPATIAYAGSKLDVKPLLTFDLDGRLTLIGVARGRKKGIKQLASYYEKNVARAHQKNVVVAHADCPKDAERLKEAVGKIDENILILESHIGPVIGSHVGPEMIAIVFWGNDRREELSVADKIARKVKRD